MKDKQNRETSQIVLRFLALVRSLPHVQLPKHSYFPCSISAAQSVANSKENTDLNWSETPVERRWAGIGQQPRGPPPTGTHTHGTSKPPWPEASAEQNKTAVGPTTVCHLLPYFPGATPNHHRLKHLFKKATGVALGGNSVNRHQQKKRRQS